MFLFVNISGMEAVSLLKYPEQNPSLIDFPFSYEKRIRAVGGKVMVSNVFRSFV